MKLFWKIYLAVCISFTAVVALVSYATMAKQIADAEGRLIHEHAAIASFVSADIERRQSELQWPFKNLTKLSEHHDFLFWWIVRDDGTIHLANDASFIGSSAFAYFPEAETAAPNERTILNRKKNYGIYIKSFEVTPRKWSFWLGFSLKELAAMQTEVARLSALILLSAVGTLAAVLYITVKHFTKPIAVLAEGAAIIGQGDLSHRVQIQSNDELGYLSRCFNEMAEHLQTTTTSIDNLNREISDRKKAEQEIQRSSQIQTTLNKLLSLSLENPTLEEILEQAIDRVTSVPWLAFESKGAIFLVGDEPGMLVMKAQRGLARPLQTTCACVPFGRCNCGRAALSADLVFKDCVDEDHENSYEAITPHGHYCVPILSAGKVIGVINTYLKAGHSYNEKEADYLWAVSAVLAGIIERKRAEQKQAELLKKVESANKELKDFAYVVSHDLKAPLRGIKTLAQWLSTDYADKLDQNGREQMNLLLSRVDRMHNLIDGVLQYSRVGRVQEKKVQVNLNELVAEVIDMIAPPENISIMVENELPVIEFERTRIAQVFQNLLSNAVKYMDKPQGQVRICCVEEDGFWKFRVSDNGPGIEEKYFEKIFQMFQTLAPRDEVESTGVGLTIAKKIVELYGGKIWVESKVGQGSTFIFTIPKDKVRVENAELQASIIS